MIKGLEIFRKHFSAFTNQYVLIGGTACTVVMEEGGLQFRATKDLDIVLHVETLDHEFVATFWDFISKGRYRNRQQSTGKDVFYRFYSPETENFPMMLELFSRRPESINLKSDSHLTPIPTAESISSLSAILLDKDYYHFIHAGKQNIGGISVVDASHLIPLKARAWLDLKDSKQSGTNVDERDIRKHKNDVIRLYQLLTPTTRIIVPDTIRRDMEKFLKHLGNEPVNLKNLGLKQISIDELLHNLRQIYSL
ncbi:MAG: hypothetical protein K940chlam9_01384 [Chlamydiae bacterium]|nr:hypothetical protein [Chlamydiota bacterium]